MNFKGELFLAWRYLKPQKSLVTLLTYISLLGPILGVGVLIVVMSVMNGMPREFVQKMMEYHAHVKIQGREPIKDADKLIKYLEDTYDVKAAPVTSTHVFLQKDKIHGFLAKGVYPPKDKDVSQLKNYIDKRYMPEYKLKPNEIVISQSTYYETGIKAGDEILLHSPEKYKKMLEQQSNGETDRVYINTAKKFKVAGYFSLGSSKIDKNFIIMHQDSANELLSLNWGDATEIEMTLKDPKTSIDFINNVLRKDNNLIGYHFIPWQNESDGIYNRIQREKALMMFVLFFIMGGAAIGVAACIFSLVIQKTKEIGILKATGANPLSIIVIFLSQGAFIGILGSLIGFGGGLLVLRYREYVAKFLGAWDKELYRLDHVPMYLDPNDINMIFWGSIIICIVASIIPAIIAACVNPVKALHSGG
ncbi:MAG: FtsX-like permease family protein [Lentisphaeraceae bacterium]|nr:FtsX-like permease family protein [Lentisphaeraceae bacterium]